MGEDGKVEDLYDEHGELVGVEDEMQMGGDRGPMANASKGVSFRREQRKVK